MHFDRVRRRDPRRPADRSRDREGGRISGSVGRGGKLADDSMGDGATNDTGCSLIEELEAAIAHKGTRERAEMFRRVADLFAVGSAGFEPEQVKLFDDVTGRLVGEVDVCARADISRRLAGIANAPPMIIRTLALDPSIDVAGPILSQLKQNGVSPGSTEAVRTIPSSAEGRVWARRKTPCELMSAVSGGSFVPYRVRRPTEAAPIPPG